MTDKAKKKTNRYHTQWAGQFYVAAELTRRGYYVTFTLGNAPHTDLLVVSPSGKMFKAEVKTQKTKNFWLVRKHPVEKDHFYFLVYLPKEEPPTFFILPCKTVQSLREAYAKKPTVKKPSDNFDGFNWTDPHPHRDRWDTLPK